MEGGVLQQYATPAELKERPANLFIGTFIGEPPMNVFAADVTTQRDDGELRRSRAALRCPIPQPSFPGRVRDRLAEDGEIDARHPAARAACSARAPVKGKVISCQWLGDQTHVAVDVGGRTVVSVSHERVVARSPARTWPERRGRATCTSSIRQTGSAHCRMGASSA